ncbi:MAG: hypothetical protein PHX08_06440 [Lachnospiraceae bacterium]|nr:hypothetical protein [Lachnospiraceae bacterium]
MNDFVYLIRISYYYLLYIYITIYCLTTNGEVLRNAKTGWYDSKLNEIYAMDEVIYKGRKCSIVKESNNFKIKVKEKQSWILKSFSDLNEETAPLCTIVYRGLYENM